MYFTQMRMTPEAVPESVTQFPSSKYPTSSEAPANTGHAVIRHKTRVITGHE